MKKKIAIAFAGLLLILTASFAPIVQAPVPGCDTYVTMGGKFDGKSWMFVNDVACNFRAGVALPLFVPFATRAPYLSPLHLIQDICFGAPVDVNYDTVPDIIPIQKIQVNPIVHYQYIAFRHQWWRYTLLAVAPGSGVIFINPAMPGDVDVLAFNNDTGVYWGSDTLGASPLAGQFAAASGGYYNLTGGDWVPSMTARFPSPGLDGVPGTSFWGDPADGFGDGVPDPKGSSILMLPLVLFGDEWNATTMTWDSKIFVPQPLVLTTGRAFDEVTQWGATPPEQCYLYGTNSTEVGEPWDFCFDCLPWDDPKAFVTVTYVAAWSNLAYCVNPDDDNDGNPDPEQPSGLFYTIDSFYEYKETKVRVDNTLLQVVADITGDRVCDIVDLTIGGLAMWSQDEGLGLDGVPGTADDKFAADPDYDARADMNCDGLIDIFDLTRIAIDIGQTIDP